MLPRKLLSARPTSGPALPPELVWSLGDLAGYTGTNFEIPEGVLEPGDVLFTASSADSSIPSTPNYRTLVNGALTPPIPFTKLAPSAAQQPSAWIMNANLCCMTVGETQPFVTGLSGDVTTTHTAFAFRNIIAPASALYRDDNNDPAFEANGNTRIYQPYPPAPYDVSPVTSPVGGLALYVGYLDDDMLFMTPPSPFTPCGRSYTSVKGASVAAGYAVIPAGGITLGRFTGGSDNWVSIFATASAA